MALDILVVDDEPDIRDLISDILKSEGFAVRTAANSSQAFKLIAEKVPSAVILDIWLQGSDLDGLGILEIIKKRYSLMPVIIISGHGTIQTAVNAIKMGAYDYIEKPFSQDKLTIVLKRACESAKLKRENLDLKSKVVDKTEFIGSSPAMVKLRSEIEKVAPTSCRVMLQGFPGTGKELVARLIHKKSKVASGPFVTFSPTMVSGDRVLQELFGEIEKQAEGISIKRLSVLEATNNGTLYIDEVGDLDVKAQMKLLEFLQDQTLVKSSENKSIKLDVRIISGTSKNMEAEIAAGTFRQELYYRLNVVPVKIPLLSERRDDIPALIKYFVTQLSKFSGLKAREFSDEALAILQSYNWPGNVRQLRNIVEWTLIMNPAGTSESNAIRPEMLPPDIVNNGFTISRPENNMDVMSMPLREAREVFERQYLSAQMSRFNNNISKTSSFVGMERSALHRKLKLLNIHGAMCKLRESEYEDNV